MSPRYVRFHPFFVRYLPAIFRVCSCPTFSFIQSRDFNWYFRRLYTFRPPYTTIFRAPLHCFHFIYFLFMFRIIFRYVLSYFRRFSSRKQSFKKASNSKSLKSIKTIRHQRYDNVMEWESLCVCFWYLETFISHQFALLFSSICFFCLIPCHHLVSLTT